MRWRFHPNMKAKPVLRFVLLILALRATGFANEQHDDWFKQFYKSQDVSKFDGFWKDMISEKRLENENQIAPLTGFTSQVLHLHPELLKGRLDDISRFPEKQRKPILNILWLSDTKEAQSILEKNKASDLIHQTPPPIGSWLIKDASDLDLCWGYYFATGDTNALVPIVFALDLATNAGAIQRYRTSMKSEEDKVAAYKDAIFGAAMWSLSSNAKENKKIASYLDKSYEDSHTPALRKRCIRMILSKVYPEKYEIASKTDKMTKVVYRILGPDVNPGSFAAKPKTLYRLNKTKSRTEEQPDPDMKLQGLIISNGPDIFMINLWDKTGKHLIDPGPTYLFHAPIVPTQENDHKPRIDKFEIGEEMPFMQSKGVKPKAGQFEGQAAQVFECQEAAELTLTVFASPKTHLPIGVAVQEGGKELVKMAYDEYSQELAADDKLFWPPNGISLFEPK